jgi:hypothetical protein
MDTQIITIIISALGVGGIISGVILRRMDKMEKKQDKRDDARAQESVLIVRGLQAVGHLAEATAIAQKNGHVNGEMDTAFKYYRDYNDDMNAFLLEQNAARNHGR